MKEKLTSSVITYLLLALFLFLSLVPVILMLFMSFKDTVTIYGDFWAFPWPPKLNNYSTALHDLWAPAVRTVILAVCSIAGIQLFATMASYGFARLRFLGKEVIFYAVILLMMIPGILSLTPRFILAINLGIRDRILGLGVFYVAGGQPPLSG